MSVSGRMRRSIKALLAQRGFEIIETSRLYDWQRPQALPSAQRLKQLPLGAIEYLVPENPRLVDLEQRYAHCDSAVTKAFVWHKDYLSREDLVFFRDDNPYVFQLRGRNMNELSYALTYYAAKANAKNCSLLDRLVEDSLFGVHTSEIDDRLVSRDLLDSVAEINFLERHLRISEASNLTILDIGAGYGRLAYRAVTAVPSIRKYLCADAVAASSFVCEYYLRFRGVDDRAHMIPLDEIESALSVSRPELAINVHSFSECSLDAIGWWCALLSKSRVEHLMVVPNSVAADGVTLLNNAREDFSTVLRSHGYRLIAADPKYPDPIVQKYGINPIQHFLFRLE